MAKKKREPVIVWGCGGHARVMAELLQAGKDYDVAAFVDDVSTLPPKKGIGGKRVITSRDALLTNLKKGLSKIVIGIGDGGVRVVLGTWAVEQGFELITAVHPSAIVSPSAEIGVGTMIAAGAFVGTCAKVGDHVILNTQSGVDRDCVVEDGVHLCPGARLAGSVRVGRAAWLGIGTVVTDGVQIGAGSYLGAGSVVVKDIPIDVLAFGVPAKVQKRLHFAQSVK